MFRTVAKTVVSRQLPSIAPRLAAQCSILNSSKGPLRSLFAAPLRSYSSSTPIGKIDKPTYQLTFTCKACTHRSSHLVSKQAYHHGTVLIQCDGCKNRHLIADHLNVFGQGKKTLQDILNEKGDGEKVTETTIDLNKLGDIEWESSDKPPEQHLLGKD